MNEVLRTVYLGRDNSVTLDFQLADPARGEVVAPYLESVTRFVLKLAGNADVPDIDIPAPDVNTSPIFKQGRIALSDGTEAWRLVLTLGAQAVPAGRYGVQLDAYQGADDLVPTALVHPEDAEQRLTLQFVA